jgi:type I restriction-modification system DNA methylase subunit
MTPAAIVSKLWNFCNVLRDDGMSYGDYVEQLTYLLFLEMADERTKPPYNQPSTVPAAYAWPALVKRPATSSSTTTATPWKPRQREGPAWADLQQVAEQVPGPGQAAPADRSLLRARG